MRVIDTSAAWPAAYGKDGFAPELWRGYIDAAYPGAAALCLKDMKDTLAAGYAWETWFLPVLNAVPAGGGRLDTALGSFRKVTERLDERIRDAFGRTVDADLVLYLGLCCGAGWVTQVNGRTAVLLGIEKILELNWCGVDAMNGLILHELGHVYQAQYGVLYRDCASGEDDLLWQLFTEGIAMVFEQTLAGGENYYHQDRDGWRLWCAANEREILRSFRADLPVMRHASQRYFGDWVSFRGMPDTGYYLGTRFVRFLMRKTPFDVLIGWDIPAVRQGFDAFCRMMDLSGKQV